MTPIWDREYLQALLDVEVALAAAEAEAGVIPASCVPDIRAAARAEAFDLQALTAEAVEAGNIVIPLVRKLTEPSLPGIQNRQPTFIAAPPARTSWTPHWSCDCVPSADRW